MALTVTEASAVNRVIDFVVGAARPDHDPARDDRAVLAEALAVLARSANKTLMAGATPERVAAAFDAPPQPGSALAALAVVDGLETHLSHNGSLPWPSVRRPLEAWRGEPLAR